MNVYDFDDTIYDGDTNKDLLKYSLKKYPLLVIKSLLKTIIPFLKPEADIIWLFYPMGWAPGRRHVQIARWWWIWRRN